MNKKIMRIVSGCIILSGIGVLLYPMISGQWNAMHQTRPIAGYGRQVAQLNDREYTRILDLAHSYNEELWEQRDRCFMTGEKPVGEYDSMLNIGGTGIMGSIEIPSIHCRLPIYHGTDERVLQAGAGHVSASSLPVGGENTHCVLIGHQGLPSAKLFTDLDKLEKDDIFRLHVLDDTLTYRVEKIEVVLPEKVEMLTLEEGEDRCTLVTCTPYGINSHRLLVEGVRVDESSETTTAVATGDAGGFVFWLAVTVFCSVIVFVVFLFWRKVRKRLTNN